MSTERNASIEQNLGMLIARVQAVAEQQAVMRVEAAEFRAEVRDNMVTKTEFLPVRTIVYGGAAIILVGVFTAMVYLVLRAP